MLRPNYIDHSIELGLAAVFENQGEDLPNVSKYSVLPLSVIQDIA